MAASSMRLRRSRRAWLVLTVALRSVVTGSIIGAASPSSKRATPQGGICEPIALSDDHRALFESMRDAVVRGDEPTLATIAVPEALGGDGGDVVDLAVALEGCAYALLP